MELKEKLNLLEDMLEVELNSLKLEDKLEDIDEYDSMSKLSLIVLMDDEFNKKLEGETILGFKTVGDIINFME